jgi:hypothetical protein
MICRIMDNGDIVSAFVVKAAILRTPEDIGWIDMCLWCYVLYIFKNVFNILIMN